MIKEKDGRGGMQMLEKRIPRSIKERLRRRLLENVRDSGVFVKENIKERLRRRLLESKIRAKIRERMKERFGSRFGMRRVLSERLRRRLLENRVKERLRRRLLEGRDSDIKLMLRERLRRRLLESRSKRVVGFDNVRGSIDLSERRVTILKKRNELLERELRRKTKLLKEAYKIVKRVEEFGGIQKIEKAMKLAHDTIVKAGAKLFKEAVCNLSAETGVDKKRVAELVKKVGLKEAREILKKKGNKVGKAPKTIIVEGIDDKKEQFPVLATRIAERLSKPVEAGNPGDLKQLSEAIFKKVVE
jgi:hypothetical protein